MPRTYAFRALQFPSKDQSTLIAPPYDVLDAAGKAKLLASNPNNIVAIDLPHTPAKELGPASAYEAAATRLKAQLADGTLKKRSTPAMFAYRQTFTSYHTGTATQVQRCGMACTVDVVPFGPRAGGGVLPHEETFSGPKEDRFALMKATATQLSPIFGLHPDESGTATKLVRSVMASRPADITATTAHDRVQHELWTIEDHATIEAYQKALATEDIFIADGHHRYTTGLNYLKALEAAGSLASDHPSRQSMMVLVSMSDPGLVIWPTHRVLGGMQGYSWDKFLSASSNDIRTEPVAGDMHALERALHAAKHLGEERFALWDFASGRGCLAIPAKPDALATRFPEKPKAWRELSVAFCQYVIVEKLCQGQLNGGNPVKWAFPHTIDEVKQIGSGEETGAGGGKGFAQLAVIVRATPLSAVRDVSRANQLMPQKSTFFYPKLATGLFMHALA
jgi:uncharacterized protein (DUF1015 family)